MSKMLRTLRLVGATGELRTASFEDREHLVVPVVALIEGVVWPANAPYPELVLASEFSRLPQVWDGRPVVMDHPKLDDQFVSANCPEVLESFSFGRVFNTKTTDHQLLMEAWLDPQKAEKVGSEAVRVCERAKAGEPIEISVGVYMTLEKKSGIYNGPVASSKGKKYEGIWHDIGSDHLAMLPEGTVGACSIEMGCGAPRAASAHKVTSQGLVPLFAPKDQKEKGTEMNLTDKLKAFFAFRDARSREDMTFREIERALGKLLQDTEPGFLGVSDVAPDEKKVMYATMDSDYNIHHWRRGYKLATNGEASLAEDREAVEMVTRWETLSAVQPNPQPTAACGCQKNKGETDMNRTERIAALIQKGKATEADRPMLETCSETILKALEVEAAGQPAPNPTPQPPPTPNPNPAPGTTQPNNPTQPGPQPTQPSEPTNAAARKLTREEYLASLPDDVRENVEDGMRMAEQKRTTIIATLKATNRCPFTEDELKKKTTKELESFVTLAGVTLPTEAVSFEGRAIPVTTGSGSKKVSEPPSLIAAVQNGRQQKAS
jgi:hypothetical protein